VLDRLICSCYHYTPEARGSPARSRPVRPRQPRGASFELTWFQLDRYDPGLHRILPARVLRFARRGWAEVAGTNPRGRPEDGGLNEV